MGKSKNNAAHDIETVADRLSAKLDHAEAQLRGKQSALTRAQRRIEQVREAIGAPEGTSFPALLMRLQQYQQQLSEQPAAHSDFDLVLLQRQTKIISALGLLPTASWEEVIAKLVELSDAAFDGRRVIEQLVAVLSLPTPTTIEAIVATVRGFVQLREQTQEPQEPKAKQPDGPDDEARAALHEIRVGLSLAEDASPADIVSEVRWVHEMCNRNRCSSDEADAELTETKDEMERMANKLKALQLASVKLAALAAVVGKEGNRVLLNFAPGE
jgi:hypothetical protein